MRLTITIYLSFFSIPLFSQEVANFIYSEGKSFIIKTYNNNLNTETYKAIDYSNLNGYFNSTNYNIAYSNEQIQLSNDSKDVYFKLHEILNNNFTHSLYKYNLEAEQFDTITHISNEMIDWWKIFPDQGFILAYGELNGQLILIDLETKEQLPFEDFDDKLKYISTDIIEDNILVRAKEDEHFIQLTYNTQTDHIQKDTLFNLELEEATLIYQHPFLIESDKEKQLFVLHNMQMTNEKKIPFNGSKIHHDKIRRQFLIPGKDFIYSVDYELRVRDSISMNNGSIYLETDEGYIVRENIDSNNKTETTYIISKDFKENSIIQNEFIDEHLTSVQYTRAPLAQ